MKTFITEVKIGKETWAGPEIKAESWAEAEAKARDLKVEVIGEEG